MTSHPPLILCFGEVLWDCLPQGLFPGGAPINVAYHLHRLGCQAVPVTAVGRDFLGEELMRRFERWGLPRAGVAWIEDKRTGAVLVELDDQGSASYRILEDMAWDWIEMTAEGLECASRAHALVYGSLAQRAEHNVRTWDVLRGRCPGAHRVFDVNLRAPYDDLDRVRRLARSANVIKLNDAELARLVDQPACREDLEKQARTLADQSGCAKICVTAGAHGAGLLWDGHWSWESTRPVKVRDTIGAGDSFLAGFLHAWLAAKLTPGECLQRACRLSEFVASCSGATPAYEVSPQGRIQPG